MKSLDIMKAEKITLTLTLGELDELSLAAREAIGQRILPSQRQTLLIALQKMDEAVNV